MTRRELFKRLTGSLAAAGVTVSDVGAIDAPCDPKRALVVVSVDQRISLETAGHIKRMWERTVEGTAWEGVRAIVLDRGMSLEVHDAARFGVRKVPK